MMATQYSIYTLKNVLTGQNYVGKTKRPKIRHDQHFSELRAGKHHSSKLQSAFNAYSESAFQWKLLQVNIPEAEGEKWEIFWIAALDAFSNGYNMTNGYWVANPPIPCSWDGVLYPSQAAAANALGISRRAMRNRLARGYAADEDMPFRNRKLNNLPIPCSWNGEQFASISEAAEALGVAVETMRQRLVHGYTSDEDSARFGNDNTPIPVTWNGVIYPSLGLCCKALGITMPALLGRLRKGYARDEDMPRPTQAKKVTLDGVEYPSLTTAARALGIDPATIRRRVGKGKAA